MTKIYLFGCFLGVASIASAQNSDIQEHSPNTYFTKNTKHRTVPIQSAEAKGGDENIIYWSEDFSNGMDGQGDNGSWSTEEENGGLWFVTYPPEIEGGYDMSTPLVDASVDYGDHLPNWYEGTDILGSTTRDNGLMMMDADRFNSTATEEDPDNPVGNTLSNSLISALVSPSFDLTGVESAQLSYWHSTRFCCATGEYALSVEVSVDDGDTWIPFDGYTDYSQFDGESTQINIDISDVLQGATNLTECRVKFNWNGGQTHYYWMLDDIAIVSVPANDLVAGSTWYNSFHEVLDAFENTDFPAADYYNEFEYLYSPDYFARPFDFAMEVTNNGTQTQTNVVLTVTITAPDGTTDQVSTEPITLESGVMDTLSIPGYELSAITPELQYGNYGFEYEVSQAEVDERPDNNVGGDRGHNISTEAEDDFGIFMNGENTYGGAYTDDGQDRIFGTALVFSDFTVENKAITHIEAVFLWSEDFAETIAGEVVYFNLRQGSVLEEDDADPETATTVFFDSDNPLTYEAENLAFTIEEEDIWLDTDGQPFVWSSIELPTPILIESGVVYQAEYRIPAAGDNIVFSPTPDGDQEKYSSLMYDFDDGGWFYLGEAALPIRVRTGNTTGLEQITHENGIKLTQNFPNPFTDDTRIQYQLDETNEATFEVFDMAGKLVYSQDLGLVPAGAANVLEFNRKSLSSGVYTYSITTATERVTRKMTIE